MAAVPSIGRATAVAPRPDSEGARATHDLYERYARQIYNYCLHQLGNREEAEDATQSTFLNAFRGLERGISPEFESAWLFKIAQNVCLTRRRSSFRRRRVESPGDLDAMQDVLPSRERDADELLRLTEALQDMPEQQRRALLLREWQGLSYKEIGDELELSQAAVETLLFRARRSLADGLVDETRPKERTLRSRLRAGGDLGSVLAVVKTLFFSGGAKVVASVATVAATGAVAASPDVRHDVARIVQPVVAPTHKAVHHATNKPATPHRVRSHTPTPASMVAPVAAKHERRALPPAKTKVRVVSKTGATAPPAYALERHGVVRTPTDEARPAVTPSASTPTPVTPAPVEQQPVPVQPTAETPAPAPTPTPVPAQEQPRQVEPVTPAPVPVTSSRRDLRKADDKDLPRPATTPSGDRGHSDNVGRKDAVERAPSAAQPAPATDAKQDRRQEARPTPFVRDRDDAQRADNIHWKPDQPQTAPTPSTTPEPATTQTTTQLQTGRRGRDAAPPAAPTPPPAPTPPTPTTPAVPAPPATPPPSQPDDRRGRDRRQVPPAVPTPPVPQAPALPAVPAPVAPAPPPVAPAPAQPAPTAPVADQPAPSNQWPSQGHRRR
jgi:RNA polymerase sigma factor (sigma-70 family)